ncbi:MAG: type 4a pilus biogenesis protein PilO [Gemmatimonadales bacterium]
MGASSKTTGILLALIAVAFAYMCYSGDGISLLGMHGLMPRMAYADSLRDSIKVLHARIDTAKKDLATQSVEDVTKRVAEYQASLALLKTLVPTQRDVNNLLDDVTTRSRVRGVRITSFVPGQPLQGPAPFDTWSYDFTVVGHYHPIAEFLTDIASLRRIMVPGGVHLTGANSQQARAFGDTTAMVEAHFTVRTYVKPTTAEDSTNAN